MSIIEDRILVWRLNAGDSGAMRRIYEKHRTCLMRVASALLNDRSQVEDVLHDVIVGFAETAGRFELKGSLRAFLSICVANRARDVNRSVRRRGAECVEEAGLASRQAGPEAETMRLELATIIEDAMAQLPGEQREVVVLHLVGELPFRQIARLRDISINTAMSRYRYGLEKIRTALEGVGCHA
ncbi:MAG: sigma-70 family RNA polymerase sigma factor [Acidobacteria bacterium]|nr:sigma-70 family RNA polymerase sigma factor [Acidobacteriota bacterium]